MTPELAIRFSAEREVVPISPVVRGRRCYFECSGRPSELLCVDLDDGRVVWRRPSGNFFPFATTTDTLVLCSVNEALATTEDGIELWRLPTGLNTWRVWRNRMVVSANPLRLHDIDTGRIADTVDLPMTPWGALLSGDCFLGFTKDGCEYVACDLPSEQILWSLDLRPILGTVLQSGESDPLAKAPGVGEVFVLSSRANLFAFSVMSGDLLWRKAIKTFTPPAVTRDRVYSWDMADGTPAHLICLDAQSGETIFDQDLSQVWDGFSKHFVAYTPLVHQDSVILPTRQGMLCAVSRDTGNVIWKYRHKRELGRPLIANNELIVLTRDGMFLKFALGAA
jgi:outer membrane protein assembly factor BamB